MENKSIRPGKRFLAPLIAGGILQALPVLSAGNTVLQTVSALLWPFFFLLASRRAQTKRQFWLCMAVLAFTKFLRNMLLYGTAPLYMLGVLMLSVFIALCESVAFGLDHLAVHRDSPVASFVFPILYTASTCLIVALNIGNLTNPGAVLANIPVLAQCASVILEHGLTFLLAWISSMLAFAENTSKRRRVILIIVSAAVVIIVLCFGSTRLHDQKEPERTVRVALCTSYNEPFNMVSSNKSSEEYYGLLERELAEASGQKADLAVFVEEHTVLHAEELFLWLDKISGLVESHGIPVLLPIEVAMPEGEKGINEAILFDGSGAPVLTYVKNNLVPLIETSSYETGSDRIGQAVIDIGGKSCKLAVAICFDCNDAVLIRKMDADTDLVLCPAWEWANCNKEQRRSVILRAVENDVTLIKATQDGYHFVADPYGNILFSEDTAGKYETVTVVEAPLYSKAAKEAVPFTLPTINATSACELTSAIMMLILFVAMCSQMGNSDRKSHIYTVCVLLALLGLLSDAFSYIFDGSSWSDSFCFFINLSAYVFVDMIMIAFALYFRALLGERRGTRYRLVYATMLVPLFDIIFLIYAAFKGNLFSITNGGYLPGPWDAYTGYGPSFSIVSVLVIALLNRKKLAVREYSAIILYMVLPLCASLSVTFIGGNGSLSYVAVSLSLLILFVLIQAGTIEESRIREKVLSEVSLLDQLTSLGNRRAFDTRLAEYNEFAPFAAVFCDVNGLKETNDTYGHAAGDELLLRFSNILKQHFDLQDIYRISGDEFVILPADPTPENVEQIVDRLKKDIALQNGIAAVGWAFGAAATKSEIVKLAETRMYVDKRRYHATLGENE